APSDPKAIPPGLAGPPLLGGTGNSVTVPAVVICPMLLLKTSVNHSAPSGPAAMERGWLAALVTLNSVIVPLVEIRPICPLTNSANQSAQSGPATMPIGRAPAVGTLNSVIACATARVDPPIAVISTAPRIAAHRFDRLPGITMNTFRDAG